MLTPHIEPNRKPREAAQRLGIGLSKLYELLRAGNLKAVKVGTATLVLGISITEFEASLPAFVPLGRKASERDKAAA